MFISWDVLRTSEEWTFIFLLELRDLTTWPSILPYKISPVASVGRRRAYLDLSELPGALHPAGHVNGVAPDVILRLPRSDHSSYHRAVINACGETTGYDKWVQCSHAALTEGSEGVWRNKQACWNTKSKKWNDPHTVVAQRCTRVQMFIRNEITLLAINTMLFLCCDFSQGHISKADFLSGRLTNTGLKKLF